MKSSNFSINNKDSGVQQNNQNAEYGAGKESISHSNGYQYDELARSSTRNSKYDIKIEPKVNRDFPAQVVPFFSIRKLRVVYYELQGNAEFGFTSFEAFKQDVLSSIAPQLELNRWESLASRR